MSVQERVHELLEPVVATLGVELVEVDFTGGTLRVSVDEGDGITTERLTEVNRLVSPILDQHDPVPGRYTLEVSSPGLERPLKRLAHYRRAVGETVVVKMVPDVEPRRVKGRLLSAGAHDGADQAARASADDGPSADDRAGTDAGEAGAVVTIEVVEIDGVDLDEPEERRIAVADVATARTVFDWGPSPKPGQPGSKKTSGQKKPKQSKGSKTPSRTRGAR